jgi:hypothetical protein
VSWCSDLDVLVKTSSTALSLRLRRGTSWELWHRGGICETGQAVLYMIEKPLGCLLQYVHPAQGPLITQSILRALCNVSGGIQAPPAQTDPGEWEHHRFACLCATLSFSARPSPWRPFCTEIVPVPAQDLYPVGFPAGAIGRIVPCSPMVQVQ